MILRTWIAQFPHWLTTQRDQKIISLDTKKIEEIAESQRSISSKCEFTVGMSRCLTRAVFGKMRGFHRHEILHEQITFIALAQVANGMTYAQLNGAHQLVSGHFFVRDFAGANSHSAMTDFTFFITDILARSSSSSSGGRRRCSSGSTCRVLF